MFSFLTAPESLTMYCRSLLDAGRSRFLCPYISEDQPPVYCGVEWEYIDVRRLAVLTDAEIEEFEKKISKNYLIKAMGIQECPKCNSMVERSDKKHIRVVCPLCSKNKKKCYEFCWHCLHEWTNGSSTIKCGEFLVYSIPQNNGGSIEGRDPSPSPTPFSSMRPERTKCFPF